MKKILLASILLSPLFSNAQIIFQQDFSTLTAGALNGQNSWTNSTSSGGTGGLVAGAENVSVSSATLNYPNYGNSSKVITMKQVDQDGPGHLLPSAINSGTYYFSFLANFSSYPTATSYYDVVRLLNGGAFTTSARIWVQPGSTATGFKVGIKIGDSVSPAAITLSDYAFNQTHLFVIKYTINPSSSDDVMSLYIDPVFANGEPATATLTAPVSPYEYNTNIDRIAFPYNTPKAGKSVGNIGLVSVARTWSQLAFPATLSTSDISKNNKTFNVEYSSEIKSLKILQSGYENSTFKIVSMDGKLMKTVNLNAQKNQIISCDNLSKGVYLIYSADGQKIKQKFIVQ